MIDEARRRACLRAMGVDLWLPRTPLPHAAPSRPAQLAEVAILPVASALPAARPQPVVSVPAARPSAPAAGEGGSVARRLAEVLPIRPAKLESRPPPAPAPVLEKPAAPSEPVPRFSLQFMRAGGCLLVIELPNGEPLQGRDPARRLLDDLLRAAGLPPVQAVDEPLRWPVLRNQNFDRGPDGARQYIGTLLLARLEQQPASAVWLVGERASRFSGVDDQGQLAGAGFVWQLPGLDELIAQPARKRGLWHDMQRVMPRWTVSNE